MEHHGQAAADPAIAICYHGGLTEQNGRMCETTSKLPGQPVKDEISPLPAALTAYRVLVLLKLAFHLNIQVSTFLVKANLAGCGLPFKAFIARSFPGNGSILLSEGDIIVVHPGRFFESTFIETRRIQFEI